MKQSARAGLAVLVASASMVLPAHGVEYQLGHIIIERPWSVSPPADTSQPAFAYLTITNLGDVEDVLVSAATSAANSTELLHDAGDGTERSFGSVENGIAVPSGGTVELVPHGPYICIMGLDAALEDGDSFPLTLQFEAAGTIEVDVVIGTPDPVAPAE